MNDGLQIHAFGEMTIRIGHAPITKLVSRKVEALLVYITSIGRCVWVWRADFIRPSQLTPVSRQCFAQINRLHLKGY